MERSCKTVNKFLVVDLHMLTMICRKKILLINDTGDSTNPGCKMVCRALYDLFGPTNHRSAISESIPLGYWSDFFRDISAKSRDCLTYHSDFPTFTPHAPRISFRIWKHITESLQASDTSLYERLEACDAVIVNGEGSIHHNFMRGLALLALMKTAITFNRPVLLLNATIQAMQPKILRSIVPGLKLVHARENRTFRELKRFSNNILCAPDLAFLAIQNAYVKDQSFPNAEKFCLITAGVIARAEILRNLFDAVTHTGLKPLYLCIGDGGEEKRATIVCREYGVDMVRAWEIPTEEIISFLSQFPIAISGRHHINIFLLRAGVPFIPIPSNTWKIEETLSMVKYPVDVVRRQVDLNYQLDYVLKNRDTIAMLCKESFNTGLKMMEELQKRIELCGY